MGENHIDSRAQVKTKMRGDVHETMTEPPNNLGYESVFGTKHVDCVFGMFEGGKRLRIVKDFNAHGNTGLREQVKRPIPLAKLHPLIALHAFFTREAFVLGGIHAVSRPHQGVDVETGAGTNGSAHVVGILRIDQYHSRYFHGAIVLETKAAGTPAAFPTTE